MCDLTIHLTAMISFNIKKGKLCLSASVVINEQSNSNKEYILNVTKNAKKSKTKKKKKIQIYDNNVLEFALPTNVPGQKR